MSATGKTFSIQERRRIEVNTDSQRRCYYGAHAKSELRWTDWETLVPGVKPEDVHLKLSFWGDLNKYAVSQRGPSARKEFRAVQEGDSE